MTSFILQNRNTSIFHWFNQVVEDAFRDFVSPRNQALRQVVYSVKLASIEIDLAREDSHIYSMGLKSEER